jgi:hypothetical protein
MSFVVKLNTIKTITVISMLVIIAGCSASEEKQARHEECYKQYQCNSSSWISSALGGTKACNKCNDILFE